MRRSFSQQNLSLSHEGPHGVQLARALRVPNRDGYEGIHSFHPYPGRFHPELVRSLLTELHGAQKGVLLDPFMGSGTTLLEGRRLGWDLLGNDLNPISVQLVRVKLAQLSTQQRQALRRALLAVSEYAGQRNEWVAHPHHEELRRWYRPHSLVEMLNLWDVIQEFDPGVEREVAEMMLSAASTKFSLLKSDSAHQRDTQKAAHPKGAVLRWWSAKTYQLIESLEEESKKSPRVRLELALGDALHLPEEWAQRADVVLTSPPYPGTYDYADHHKLRALWLCLSDQDFREHEIGSRRSQGGLWNRQGPAMLDSLARAMAAGAAAYLVIGDWIEQDRLVCALDWTRSHATQAGLELESFATIERQNFESSQETLWQGRRGEHLIRLKRRA
jgi:hypothetical protein